MVSPNPMMEELIEALERLNLSRYLGGAALVISIYDWLILLGDESSTVWQGRWTLPKSIYYFNRLVTPVGLMTAAYQLSDQPRSKPLTAKFCLIYNYVNSLVLLFSFFLSNLLLTLRLVALYKRKKWIAWFLYSFLTISYLITAGLVVYTLHTFGRGLYYSQIVHACASTTKSNLMPAIFLLPAAYEFTIFTMTGVRAFHDAKLIRTSGSAPFLTVLYRDGCICFLIMLGVRIWNVWIYATQPTSASYLGIYLLWATMTILSTRVYLNLVFLARGVSEHMTAEVSRVRFAPATQLGGIKMQVQTTTIADDHHVLTMKDGRRQSSMVFTKFSDAPFDVESHGSPNRDDVSVGQRSSPRDSLRQPFSSASFAVGDNAYELNSRM